MRQGLDVGNVLQRVFDIYRDQFGLLIPAALVVFAPIAILNALILDSGFFLGFVLTFVLGVIATYLFQGMVVEAARDILDGRRDHTIRSLVSAAAPYIGKLAVAGIVAGIAIGIGFILLIAPGLYLITIWAVIAPVIVLERTGAFESLGRSQQLVKGSGWPVLGVLVCLVVIQAILAILVQAIFIGILSDFVGRLLGDLVTRTLIGPLSALAAAVIYFELKRIRGEPVPGQEATTAQAHPAAPAQPEAPTQPVTPPAQPTAPRQVPPQQPPQQS